MIDLGLNSIKNITTIIGFLKIEEMYKMVLNNDSKKSPMMLKETVVDDGLNEELIE